jgi:hypothetical protein
VLQPPDPTLSESDRGRPLPKLGEDRVPPKMRKRRMHREVEAMKEAVGNSREAAVELEEHPGTVELGIRLEKSTDQLGKFFGLVFLYDLGTQCEML